jgi:IS30 family transposase
VCIRVCDRTQRDAIGHRVVCGGDRFHEPAGIDEEALSEIQRLGELTRRRKTLTYDRGKEMVEHERLAERLAVQIFLADPYSPWQRGANGLLR